MNEQEAGAELDALLAALGVDAGRTVMLHTDMAGVPLPAYPADLSRAAIAAREQRWFAFVHAALRARLGEEGTLIVPTFTYSCSAPGSTFDTDKTPSEVGRFTEWVRARDGAYRSVHPLFSLAAIGPRARAMLDTPGGAAFGPLSPWGRFHEEDVRIVCLGVPFRSSVTYVHHLEHCYGTPHRFHKQFDVTVLQDGEPVSRDWLAFVVERRSEVDNWLDPLEDELRRDGSLVAIEWGGHESAAVDARDVDRVGYALLARDPLAFTSLARERSDA